MVEDIEVGFFVAVMLIVVLFLFKKVFNFQPVTIQ